MITKKEYEEAKLIVKLYESQQLNIPCVSNSATQVKSSGDFRDDDNRETQQEYYGK
jgi:hypothetical protein